MVEDLRYVARWEPPYPAIYVPVEQDESELVCLAVKSQLPDQRVASLLRQALASVDPLQPMEGPTRLSAILAESMSERQFVMLTTVAFACTALVLAVVGVHAGVSRRIADRRRELGIRAALGARPEDLRWLMARGELAPLIGGIALGGVTCYVIGHYIDGTQYGVEPGSVSVYAYVAGGVVAIGAAALMAST